MTAGSGSTRSDAGGGNGMIAATGATGTVGSALLEELAARGWRPLALVRPGSAAAAATLPADVVEADLERPDSVGKALGGVTRLFLLTPLHPHQDILQGEIIEAARRAHVAHVVKLSALDAGPDAATEIQRQHGRAERALVESGMTYTLLRPNAFMQNAFQWRAMIARRQAIVLPVGNARVSMIDARDVAAVAARALTDPGLDNATYELTGPEALSYPEIADCLSEAAGRPIRHLDLTPSDAAQAMRAAGMPDWAVRARLELYATYRAGEAERVTDTVAALTGQRPRRFATFAATLASALREETRRGQD